MPATDQNTDRTERVLVAMSGGVDSSACVYLLQKAGYQVGGVVFRMSPEHDQAVADARQVAEFFGVPIEVLDLQDVFEKEVIDYFCQSYLAGETPNPCVRCNPTVKFKYLYQLMLDRGYDYIATGHYADIRRQNGHWYFAQADSLQRDQSYMLYRLGQDILSHLLLPLAHYQKSEIRQLVKEAGLPSFSKPDSQENCFISDNDYAGYITHRCGPGKSGYFFGPDGSPVAPHQGILHYTVGQRKGLGIALGRPVFVRRIDPVDGGVYLCESGEEFDRQIALRDVCCADEQDLAAGTRCQVKIRSVARPCPCTIQNEDGQITVVFDTPQRAPAPGQSAVLYRDGLVIGGGIIVAQKHSNQLVNS